MVSKPSKVSILILGAGWTSTFLIPLLEQADISYAATSTTGRKGTLKFKFEHDSQDPTREDNSAQYKRLPRADTILITFPLNGEHQSRHLITSYIENHAAPRDSHHFIQLGSTGIFSIADQELWVTRHSRYDKSNPRAVAEDELIQLGGCVLNLSGLWGGARQTRNWIDRVAPSKERLRGETSLHMIHGLDVARAIIAVHHDFTPGQRWMLTDLLVYDWWALILGFAGQDVLDGNEDREAAQIKWVGELMAEQKIRALPRSTEQLGRGYDSREFWTTFKIMPLKARI